MTDDETSLHPAGETATGKLRAVDPDNVTQLVASDGDNIPGTIPVVNDDGEPVAVYTAGKLPRLGLPGGSANFISK
ncbi:hypothetical protein ACFWM1_17165 [Nocardia sp. NPDC058379]|uniref:hypothetical protein n=1 Tax=unclassified Nocardia TaxID=2637762 RepID=UPI0036507259